MTAEVECCCPECGAEFSATPEGGHQLLCGDATVATDVERVLGDARHRPPGRSHARAGRGRTPRCELRPRRSPLASLVFARACIRPATSMPLRRSARRHRPACASRVSLLGSLRRRLRGVHGQQVLAVARYQLRVAVAAGDLVVAHRIPLAGDGVRVQRVELLLVQLVRR
jgi:hypothetical protein